MNRTEMIKWLSKNTTREQWVHNTALMYDTEIYPDVRGKWGTRNNKNNDGVHVDYIGAGQPQQSITVNDVFEPVIEQPVYIDGAVYEIGLMNKEPQQFVYNCKLNMFERGTNDSIGASSVHDSRTVTHFKLVSEPERITDREAIDAIRREEAAEFMGSSGVTSEPTYSAVSMLNEAAECIGDRAAERDTDSERSMLATVNAFNAMYGTELTETQGWMFMVFLKASRAKGGDFREDDYVDGASYFALAGECDGNVRR
ncbi:hypothetical protein SIPHO054v2_p0022 [Vibrio phage 103E44.1]|nr:hypothetical protein SIPHO054v2_p0022 [Vibrio phage 103E44.1]QZI87878.1 hypothetical protein SIPHO055v2_p0022 [Vibrio phage 104E43.1]